GRARIGLQLAEDGAQERRLAHAVAPDDRHLLALRNEGAELLEQRLLLLEPLGETLDGESLLAARPLLLELDERSGDVRLLDVAERELLQLLDAALHLGSASARREARHELLQLLALLHLVCVLGLDARAD